MIVAIVVAEQIVCTDGVAAAFGVGFTRTVAMTGKPTQPLAVGAMVKVTVTGALVVLVNVPLILPDPLAAIPVTVAELFLVQLYVVPLTLLLSTIVEIGDAEQLVCVDGVAIATGVGLTVIVKVFTGPAQTGLPIIKLPNETGVLATVTVATIAFDAALITETLPDP